MLSPTCLISLSPFLIVSHLDHPPSTHQESRACLDRTRKALEPEIQRLIDANKEALRRAEAEAADALQRQREQLLMAAHAEMAQMRTNAAQERDEAIAREREKVW